MHSVWISYVEYEQTIGENKEIPLFSVAYRTEDDFTFKLKNEYSWGLKWDSTRGVVVAQCGEMSNNS